MSDSDCARLENKIEGVVKAVNNIEIMLAGRLAEGEVRLGRNEKDINSLGEKVDGLFGENNSTKRLVYIGLGIALAAQFILPFIWKGAK